MSSQEKEKRKAGICCSWLKIIFGKGGQEGQSLLEALIFSLALVSLIYCVLLVFWFWTNLLWIEHQLYQGILCVAGQKEMNLCKQITLDQINKLKPLGRLKFLKIQNFQKEGKGEILWSFYKKDFIIRQSLSLPQ